MRFGTQLTFLQLTASQLTVEATKALNTAPETLSARESKTCGYSKFLHLLAKSLRVHVRCKFEGLTRIIKTFFFLL